MQNENGKSFEGKIAMKFKYLFWVLLAGLMTAGCGGSSGSDPSTPQYHLCFTNNQDTSIYGIGYRQSATTEWSLIHFDAPVAKNESLDYNAGVLEEEPPGEGVFDVMCFDSDGNPVKQWLDAEFAKADYAMAVNSLAGNSTFGRVDDQCASNGTLYYDASKCEINGGYCVEGAICDSEHFPWYSWGCATSNCCLPEVASCTGLGGTCMDIAYVQNCHDLGNKAANALDCQGSPLTTICCMPTE